VFEVWWKIAEEIEMKKLFFYFLLLCHTVGCSQDDTSLTLVCSGTEEIFMVTKLTLDPSKEVNKVTRTYKFENKKWLDKECSEWNKDTMFCENKPPNQSSGSQHFIRVDRISGVIREHHQSIIPGKMIRNDTFEGKCERSTSNKF